MKSTSSDLAGGLLCIAIGAGFAAYANAYLRMGTISRMGEGYFPLLLSGVLVVIGILIALRAVTEERMPSRPYPWRGILCLGLGPVAFALTLDKLGFVIAVALLVLISSFGSSRMKPATALTLTVGMTALCVALFYYGLGVTVRPFGSWFTS